MPSITLNGEMTLAYPEDFRKLDNSELNQMPMLNRAPGSTAICLKNSEKHLAVTLGFGKIPLIARILSEKDLIKKAEQIAAQEGIALRKGVYVACTGPCYETPAEYRYFRSIGADAVGMSTTPEVIVARHSSIPVFGMSVITDVARDTDDEDYVTDGEAIVKAADAAADKMTLIFKRLIAEL